MGRDTYARSKSTIAGSCEYSVLISCHGFAALLRIKRVLSSFPTCLCNTASAVPFAAHVGSFSVRPSKTTA